MDKKRAAPLEPLNYHVLPTAPVFTGRQAEMDGLARFWAQPSGVLSLIGPGGAGKTALTQRFLSWVSENDPPDGVFVWSFYEEPDPNAFLQAAYTYFSRGLTADAHGAGWFSLLKDALADGGRYLLVLDGLERVQRTSTTVLGIFGEMEDPLLRGLLTRLAAGAGHTKAVITSRFPVADIERWRDRGYVSVPVSELGREPAHTLLRAHGVQGEPGDLDRLLEEYGRHALTLDLLGGAAALFFGSSARDVPNAAASAETAGDEQYHRLAAVLGLYEQHLPTRQLALLTRLCVFRFGVDGPAIETIFLGPDKEAIAGSLHGTTADELDRYLSELVTSHLLLQDSRCKFSLHPAVRDYFYRLFGHPSAVHGAVSEHLQSLTRRPGVGLPHDKETLDLLEELIYHLLQAGETDEAAAIYYHRLGANEHLNATLGEYARTYRILRTFPECPDGSAMYHCLRAFGRFDEALQWRPQNRYIRLLNGALRDLMRDPTESTRRFAEFLRGEKETIPVRSPDVPIPAAQLHLLRGEVADARRTAEAEQSMSLFGDDTARQELMLAEVSRREGDLDGCERRLDTASVWILRSGSQEHLAWMHLLRGRLALDRRRIESAVTPIEEGLHCADECGFVLLHVDLLVEQSRLRLLRGDAAKAEAAARRAIELSDAPECGYAWGRAHAGLALGEALEAQQRMIEARSVLQSAAGVMRQLRAPEAAQADRRLAQIPIASAA